MTGWTNGVQEYWIEAVAEALDAEDVPATSEKIARIAFWMETAAEMKAEFSGEHVASQNFSAERSRELKELEDRLKREREKVPCPFCEGQRRPTLGGRTEPAYLTCDACDRTGKVDPWSRDIIQYRGDPHDS